MERYRKKPVEIQAVKWTGDNLLEITKFIVGVESDFVKDTCCAAWRDYCEKVTDHGLCIETLEGDMLASVGDYIIRGIDGEFYPCKPGIFHRSYDKVVEDKTAAAPLTETPCPHTGIENLCSTITHMVESFKTEKPKKDALAYAIRDQVLYIVAIAPRADYVVESLQKALMACRTELTKASPYLAEDSLRGGADLADPMSSSTSARYGILSWPPKNGGVYERK